MRIRVDAEGGTIMLDWQGNPNPPTMLEPGFVVAEGFDAWDVRDAEGYLVATCAEPAIAHLVALALQKLADDGK